jgi:MFS family permease
VAARARSHRAAGVLTPDISAISVALGTPATSRVDGMAGGPSSSPGSKASPQVQQPEGPFPAWRSFCICLAMFSCAFNMSVLFPFVPVLVEDLGMVEDPRKPGYYAGYLTAVQQLGRILTSVCWGAFADKYGRKPVANISLVMTAVTAVAFGLCSNYWLAVALRGLNGLCDFMLGIAKLLITELIEPYHQPRAMSYLGAGWGTAVILGPSVGGFLARPAVNWPGLVSEDSFLGQYPYLLPNLFTAALCTAGLLGLQTLPEPLSPRRSLCCCRCRRRTAAATTDGAKTRAGAPQHVGTPRLHPITEADPQDELDVEEEDGELESASLLGKNSDRRESPLQHGGAMEIHSAATTRGQSGVVTSFCIEKKPRLAIAFYTLAMTIEFADPMIMSLWASAPRNAGGLGYSTAEIGTVLALTGVTLIFCQVLIYVPLNRRWGTLGMMRRLVIWQTPFWLLVPVGSAELLASLPGAQQFAYVSAVFAVRKALAEMSFTNMNIVLNNSVQPSRRGLFNGVSMSISGLGKMGGPALAGPAMAWSLTNGVGWPLDHSFVFYGCAVLTVLLFWITLKMPASIAFPYRET